MTSNWSVYLCKWHLFSVCADDSPARQGCCVCEVPEWGHQPFLPAVLHRHWWAQQLSRSAPSCTVRQIICHLHRQTWLHSSTTATRQLSFLFCCCCGCVAVFCYGTCSCTLLCLVTCHIQRPWLDQQWHLGSSEACLHNTVRRHCTFLVLLRFCNSCFSSHQPKAQEAEAKLGYTSSFSTSTCLTALSVLLFRFLHQPAVLLYSVHKPSSVLLVLCSQHVSVLHSFFSPFFLLL